MLALRMYVEGSIQRSNTLPDLRLNWYDWWLSSSVEGIVWKQQTNIREKFCVFAQ